MKKLFFLTLLILFFIISYKNVCAIENPLSEDNNIFGIHIFDENDLDSASSLVNSSGGDWGYVTFVIREDERDIARWQKVFNIMRRYHLIPIVRIATHQENGGWAKPQFDDIENWVNFLNSLNWVVKNRYVIIGNEPNHAVEWGGEVSPEEYATYLKSFSSELKTASPDFFVLSAGFDSSAPNNKLHMSEFLFLKKMEGKEPDVFDYIDGWTSHSYPNPGFSGSVNDSGPASIRAYQWELELLKKIGVNKNLPVFITETGWAHNTNSDSKYLPSEAVSKNLIKAYDMWSKDSKVAAVTPFILNYQETPFAIFSWKDEKGNFYPFYTDVQKILKREGKPIQINKGEVKTVLIPQFIKRNGKIYGAAIVENIGQVIWEIGENYTIETKDQSKVEIDSPLFFNIEPGYSGIALFREVK